MESTGLRHRKREKKEMVFVGMDIAERVVDDDDDRRDLGGDPYKSSGGDDGRSGESAVEGLFVALVGLVPRIAEGCLQVVLTAFDVCSQNDTLRTLAQNLGMGVGASTAERVPQPDELEVLLLEKSLMTTAVRGDTHGSLWKRLWVAGFTAKLAEALVKGTAAIPSFEIPSARWKELGFQGVDPATDVRGGGELALQNLVFFAENYPAELASIFRRLEEQEALEDVGPLGPASYPWAAAAIAITHCVAKLYHIARASTGGAVVMSTLDDMRQAKSTYWSSVRSEDSAEDLGAVNLGHRPADNPAMREVFCRAFRRFDSLWHRRRARYFEFPEVVKSLDDALRADLERAAKLADAHAGTSLLDAVAGDEDGDLAMDSRRLSRGP